MSIEGTEAEKIVLETAGSAVKLARSAAGPAAEKIGRLLAACLTEERQRTGGAGALEKFLAGAGEISVFEVQRGETAPFRTALQRADIRSAVLRRAQEHTNRAFLLVGKEDAVRAGRILAGIRRTGRAAVNAEGTARETGTRKSVQAELEAVRESRDCGAPEPGGAPRTVS